jgi:hypothetical protein
MNGCDTAATKLRQHRRDRLGEAGMRVGDDQLDPGQATGDQVAQKRRPRGTILAGEHVHSEDLPVALGVDASGDHAGDADDPAGLAALDRQRVQPHRGIRASVQRPVAERRHLAIQALGQRGHLRLRQRGDAKVWTRPSTRRVDTPRT